MSARAAQLDKLTKPLCLTFGADLMNNRAHAASFPGASYLDACGGVILYLFRPAFRPALIETVLVFSSEDQNRVVGCTSWVLSLPSMLPKREMLAPRTSAA